MTAPSARRVAATLLVATAILFAIGVAAEGDSHAGAAEGVEQPDVHSSEGGASEAAERRAAESAESHADEAEGGEDTRVLGVDLEAPGPVTAAIVLSVVLAAGLWLTGRRDVAVAAIVAALVFAIFDIGEIVHQFDESRSGLAVLAGVVAAGHLAVLGAVAGSRWRGQLGSLRSTSAAGGRNPGGRTRTARRSR